MVNTITAAEKSDREGTAQPSCNPSLQALECPRCSSRIVQRFRTEYPFCWACGWEDYEYVLPVYERLHQSYRPMPGGVMNGTD